MIRTLIAALAAVAVLTVAKADIIVKGPLDFGGAVFPPGQFTSPILSVEAFRLLTDSTTDDTALVQRVCDAAYPTNRFMLFDARTYTFSSLTAGSNGSGTVAGFACHIMGSGPNLQVTSSTTTPGTLLKQKDNTNTSFITVPAEAPHMFIQNVRIDGNKANQNTGTCSGASARLINMPDAGGSTKRRSVYMFNVQIKNACNDGIYAGLLRNAGRLQNVQVLDSANRNLVWASNNDWQWYGVDAGGATNDGFACVGCASFKAVNANVFENGGRGVTIASTAGDVQWVGGDIARNQQDGLVTAGGTDADGNRQARVFTGTKFFLNGLAANATYADVKTTAETGLALIGTQHQKGTAASSGGNYPLNLVNADSNSIVYMSGTQFEKTSARKPYTDTQPVNGMNRVTGDLGLKNTFATLDDTPSPIVVDLCQADTMNISLHADRQLQNPTCIWPGKVYSFNVTNVAPGGHALTYDTAYKWAGGAAPTLTAASGATDVYQCAAISTTALICNAIQNY